MQWWKFGRGKENEQAEGIVGIYETPTHISAVYAVFEESKIIIKDRLYQHAETLSVKQEALLKFVTLNGLTNVPCAYILANGEYNLNLVEMPTVPKDEVSKALRWVLKDFIRYPIEEAVLDIFEVPYIRARDNIKMVYAVTARKVVIQNVETLIAPTGLTLKYIDIPELSLTSLLIRNPKLINGCAFIQLELKGGKLMLCKENQLAITRSFELKFDALSTEPGAENRSLESLALEIQRSFDYLNSVFKQTVQNIIVIGPTPLDKNLISTSLKNALGAETYELNLNDYFHFVKPLNDDEGPHILMAACAILREAPEIEIKSENIEGSAA